MPPAAGARARPLPRRPKEHPQIAIVKLAPDLGSGRVTGTISSPNFDIPTTIAAFGNALYAVNACFTTPPTPSTPYSIVRVTAER